MRGRELRIIIHNELPGRVEHTLDGPCICCPLIVAADDPRTDEEIMADAEAARLH